MSLAYKATSMDEYFTTLGTVQQVVSLAHQINSDVTALDNHKYIAHQLALLYVRHQFDTLCEHIQFPKQ